MTDGTRRYRSTDEDSERWRLVTPRAGDIVISTRSKCGTTWMQMICALLVFQTPRLPDSLPELSPWVDWLVLPEARLRAALEAQEHRRFLKTHTPLDGLPLHADVTYIVVARHPLDMAVSLYHHAANLDRQRIAALTGGAAPAICPRPPVEEWLASWVGAHADPREYLDSLPGVMWHLSDAWKRRHRDNVVLVHYDDLREDLAGQMRRLAARLDVDVPDAMWPRLVRAATFEEMRSRAEMLAPDASGVLKSRKAFFRRGTSGAGKALLTPEQLAIYRSRASELAPADLLAWLHRSPAASDPSVVSPPREAGRPSSRSTSPDGS